MLELPLRQGSYKNVLVLDSRARGSLTTFVQRGIVLISWENEARLALRETAKDPNDGVEIVFRSISILAEPSVAVVTKNAEKHFADGTIFDQITTK